MPGRQFSSGNAYRYGFEGQEYDQEDGDYDFGARIYDPKIARWQSTDDMADAYSYLSPYVGIGNKPLVYVDMGGTDTWFYSTKGIFLGRIADKLPNALTIISDEDFAKLTNSGIPIYHTGAPSAMEHANENSTRLKIL